MRRTRIARAGSMVWRGRILGWRSVAGMYVDRPRPAPLAIPLECVGDGLPFVEVVEAYPLNGELVEEQRDATHGRLDESEPPCRDELRDDACCHWAASLPGVPLMALVAPRSATGRHPDLEAGGVGATAARPLPLPPAPSKSKRRPSAPALAGWRS
jgi:hypothetical protein